MLKTPPADSPRATRDAILDAAFDTLREEGFAGTSARAIARKGGFNQALIFYHFGSVHDLLIAALDRSSTARMLRYREELAAASSLQDKLAAASRLYREDVESGHITVLSELLAAAVTFPELSRQLAGRLAPWLALTEEVVSDALSGSGFEAIASPKAIAFAVIAAYVGMDLLTQLDGDHTRTAELFELAERVGALAAPLIAGGSS